MNGFFFDKQAKHSRTHNTQIAISYARKKLSTQGNAVAYEPQHLTPRGPIDEKLFRVVAAELGEQREAMRTLALARQVTSAAPTLHISYEQLMHDAVDTVRNERRNACVLTRALY